MTNRRNHNGDGFVLLTRRNTVAACLLAVALPCGFCTADDSETPADAWYNYYRARAAKDYELVLSADEQPLKLKPKAILNWTNPLEDGKINGSTFVWENNGRPVVVGQFCSYLIGNDKRSFCHVFSTLSDEQVLGRRNDKTFWNPKLSGETEWHVAADAPTPAASRAARLLQMKWIARQFSAYTEEATRGKRNLRFLPRPLYRYNESTKDADGGIFAYVVGNDPELLVLVECSQTQNESAWKYRFAQSTRSTTVAKLNDLDVYRYENAGGHPGSQQAVYLSKHGVETIPSVLDTDETPAE
jgi:hypothetical protein